MPATDASYLLGHGTAHIDDATNFVQSAVPAARGTPWPRDERAARSGLAPELLEYPTAERSAAFVVIHRGRLLHETDFAPYTASSRTNWFSMAKTVGTMLAGAAVAGGRWPVASSPASTRRWPPTSPNTPASRGAPGPP